MSLSEKIAENAYNIVGSIEVLLGIGIGGYMANTLINESPSVPVLYYIGFVFGSLFIADGIAAITIKKPISEYVGEKFASYRRS